jgi:hypothetical protein
VPRGRPHPEAHANLSHWSDERIERLRQVLRDEPPLAQGDGLTILRSPPHGHVAAALGAARRTGIERLLGLGKAPARLVGLALAMIVARAIAGPVAICVGIC